MRAMYSTYMYLSLVEIWTKIINHTNKETHLEALHPGNLW
jgi:hypothetical protein